MKDFFSISKTAKIVGITTETLRHYDRIDLVKPSKIDEWTGYRYYSEKEIVRLNTIKALRCMDLSLSEIKEILSYDDFGKIIDALKQAEKSAEEKIAELNYSKEKIKRARVFYEDKLKSMQSQNDIFVKEYPKRVILLSDTMTTPTLDNLWDYHRHFYNQLPKDTKEDFYFEDLAGIYQTNERSNLFAVCTKYKQDKNLKVLPKGKYLCANCTEQTKNKVTNTLFEIAKNEYNTAPKFCLSIIILSGILQWNYQIQVLIN